MAHEHTADAHAHDEHDDHGPAHGWRRWVYATNHKDIGTMYLIFACVMFFIGGAMAMIIRAELFKPGLQFVDPQFFNSMTTMHALVMIFGAVMPAWTGLANWMIPMQVGAPDMALPRLNNFSLLDPAVRVHAAAAARCSCRAAVRPAAGRCIRRSSLQGGDVVPDGDLRDPLDGRLVDPRRHQRHRDDHEHARAGHGAAQACRCSAGAG